MLRHATASAVLVLLLAAGCTTGAGTRAADVPTAGGTTAPSPAAVPSESAAPSEGAAAQPFPDVIAAELAPEDGAWQLSATISSPYDTPLRYADAFRVRTEDGAVLGVRELAHDHAAEQPFTRSLSDLVIPDGIDRIVVEARDLANGWGGGTLTVDVPTG